MKKAIFLVLTSAAIQACGGGALPQAQSANVQADIKAAETVRAEDDPKAALHLKLAKDQFALADRQAKDGNDTEASLSLARAAADAELAVALTQNVAEQKKTDVAVAKLKELTAAEPRKGIN